MPPEMTPPTTPTEPTTPTTPATPPEGTTPAAPTADSTLLTGTGATPPTEPGAVPPTSEPSWRDSLPETVRGHERLTGFKSVEELAEAYTKANLAPTVPEASAYKLPETFPIKDIGVWANKLKLTQEQLEGVIALDQQMGTMSEQTLNKAYEDGLNELFTSWGTEKDANVSAAKQVIKAFDEDGSLATLLNATKAGNNPVVVKFFANLGKKLLAEDGFIPNGTLRSPSSKNKSAAEVIFDVSGD